MSGVPNFDMPSRHNSNICIPYMYGQENCRPNMHAQRVELGSAMNYSRYAEGMMGSDMFNNTSVFGPDGVREYDPMANSHYFFSNMKRFKAMGPQKPIVGQGDYGVSFTTPLGAVNYAKSRSSDACDSDDQVFQDKSNPKDMTPILNGLTTVPQGTIPYKIQVPAYMGQHDPRLTEAQCPNGSPTNYFRGRISAFKPRFTPIETKFLQANQTREKHSNQYSKLKQMGTVSGIF
jgi:hypothetical protein